MVLQVQLEAKYIVLRMQVILMLVQVICAVRLCWTQLNNVLCNLIDDDVPEMESIAAFRVY